MNHIRHAIIGIIVVMLVIFAAPVFARIGGLDFPDSLQPNSIFSTIREVTARIFGSSNLEVSGRNNFETPNRPLGNDFTNL